MRPCPFCRETEGSTLLVEVLEDYYPSAPGHRLVVPTRHVGHIRELSNTELEVMIRRARSLTEALPADDFTIGFNDGPLAGQTVPHVHLHVIPRTPGDVPDPRGGLRWVLPATAAYWAKT